MTRSFHWKALVLFVLTLAPVTAVGAQQAMTVSGHVTSSGAALAGVHVRVPDLRIDRVTDKEGRYSFIVPSADVRGQTITITAAVQDAHHRYLPRSATLVLSGGSPTVDLDLALAPEPSVLSAINNPSVTAASVPTESAATDTLGLDELAGAVSLSSALAGRIPGLDVVSASVLGGSSSLVYRGPRSLIGAGQPLYVVDGSPMDNTIFSSLAQRNGSGGFDYGSLIQDLDIASVASVRWLAGPDAVALYGGRAADGVVVVTTKSGRGGPRFAVSASQQITSEKATHLPSYQNQYGQGLNGQFEFFDGRGGGINDSVDQSWGPRLDGRPLPQASYIEPGRPDVRLWSARPNNVEDYFDSGRTLNTKVSVQGGGAVESFRVFFGNRDTKGLTPGNSLTLRDGGAHLTVQPTSRFTLSAAGTIAQSKYENAPGTGYNEGNPFSQFTRMGRQVDTDSLRVHLHDASGAQIGWNYVDHNNPYVASLENSNQSDRTHGFGGVTAVYTLAPWLTATARGGADYSRDSRRFTIASGWLGGFPFFAAPGSFSRGGSETDEVTVQQTTAALRFDATRTLNPRTRLTVSGGVDLQNVMQRVRTAGVDSSMDVPSAGAPATATVPQAVSWTANSGTNAVFGQTALTFGSAGVVTAALRNEWATLIPGQQATTLYPAINASIDLTRLGGDTPDRKRVLTGAVLRAGWSQTGVNLNPYSIETMYAGRALSGSIAPVGDAFLAADPNLAPEVNTTFQVGTDLSFLARRLGLGLTFYHEQTSDVILPVSGGATAGLRAANSGEISNTGIETQGSIRVGDGDTGLGWEFSASAAKNTNRVERLFGDTRSVALTPSQGGAVLEAVTGEPLGVLVGHKYLRDAATGSLILTAGLPVPDAAAGLQALGSAQPKWILGFNTSLRFHWVSLSMRADGHIGGSIFSTTKLWGDYAGNLSETAARPDSGLLIAGIDATTRQANTHHVTTQDYYHALALIQEPWVYSASYIKLRDARLTLDIPASVVGTLPFSSASISLIGRNLYSWTRVSDFDPEALLSPYQVGGFEMGQLPTTRSLGVQLSIVP